MTPYDAAALLLLGLAFLGARRLDRMGHRPDDEAVCRVVPRPEPETIRKVSADKTLRNPDAPRSRRAAS